MAEIFKDEIMSDEQLDGVAGGNAVETGKDARFLSAIGALTQGAEANLARMTAAFAKLGVGVVIHGDVDGYADHPDWNNEYFINGKQVTREAALKAATARSKAKFDANTGEAMDYTNYL